MELFERLKGAREVALSIELYVDGAVSLLQDSALEELVIEAIWIIHLTDVIFVASLGARHFGRFSLRSHVALCHVWRILLFIDDHFLTNAQGNLNFLISD